MTSGLDSPAATTLRRPVGQLRPGPSAGPVQREHEPADDSFPEWIGAHQFGQLGNDLTGPAQLELGVVQLLAGDQPCLGQPPRLRREQLHLVDLGVRRSAPQGERFPEPGHRLRQVTGTCRVPCGGLQVREDEGVQFVQGDVKLVTTLDRDGVSVVQRVSTRVSIATGRFALTSRTASNRRRTAEMGSTT